MAKQPHPSGVPQVGITYALPPNSGTLDGVECTGWRYGLFQYVMAITDVFPSKGALHVFLEMVDVSQKPMVCVENCILIF